MFLRFMFPPLSGCVDSTVDNIMGQIKKVNFKRHSLLNDIQFGIRNAHRNPNKDSSLESHRKTPARSAFMCAHTLTGRGCVDSF